MANKFSVKFDGFDEVVARLSKLEGDVKKITEKALKETHANITPNLHLEMVRHRRTGQTEKSIVENAKIDWVGSVASVNIGFDISNGGLPSIFLMYGTPRMKKDQKLYNAIYSKKTKKDIMKIQEDVFYEAIREAGG